MYLAVIYYVCTQLWSPFYQELDQSFSWTELIFLWLVEIVGRAIIGSILYIILNVALYALLMIVFNNSTREILQVSLMGNKMFNLNFNKIPEEYVMSYEAYIETNVDSNMVQEIKELGNSLNSKEELRQGIISISEYVAGMYYVGGPAYSALADRDIIKSIDAIVKHSNGNYKLEKSWIVGLLTDLQYTLSGHLDESNN